MIKIILLLIGAGMICHGRPPIERSLHVVYSKMLDEVGTLQAERKSGVSYVYSITASELPSSIESASLKSSHALFPQEIVTSVSSKEIVAAPKVLLLRENLSSSKQIKEKETPFLSINPFDPKSNESGIS